MYAMDTKSITDVEIKKSGRWFNMVEDYAIKWKNNKNNKNNTKIKNVIISGNRFLPKGYATFRLYIKI